MQGQMNINQHYWWKIRRNEDIIVLKNISKHNYIKKVKEAIACDVVPVVIFNHLQTFRHKWWGQ